MGTFCVGGWPGTKNLHKAINVQSCKLKNSWWQNYLFHVCMPTFLTFSWGFSALEIFVCSSVHSKSHKECLLCLVIILWKCEYCLIWVLNKSILFGSNSLKVSLLCDMYPEENFYYSLIWKEFPENVNSAWYNLFRIVYQQLSESVSIVWYQIWNMFAIVGSNYLKVWILLKFFWLNVLLTYALGFHACIFWSLG